MKQANTLGQALRIGECNVVIPSLTPEQLKAARSVATVARRERAELKQALRKGDLTVSQALAKASKDETLAHIKVFDLLRAIPRVGEKRAHDLMKRLEISESRRIRGLGRHQLAGLKAEFE